MAFEQPLPPINAADPGASFLSSSCLDLLLIELVPTAQQLARQPQSVTDSGEANSIDEDEQKEIASRKLEAIGYRVGQGIAERFVQGRLLTHVERALIACTFCRFSKDHPRFLDTLDVIKFLCKDLWTLVFRKQIDNLKTNHRVSK